MDVLADVGLTFNSLFEMLDAAAWLFDIRQEYAFNSLFEMQEYDPPPGGLFCCPFNSLFEMPTLRASRGPRQLP